MERLILFGSQARSEASTERLPGGLYTAPFSDPRWQQIVDLVYDISLDCDVYLSPLVMSEREFQSWSPLVERIKAEGIEIWYMPGYRLAGNRCCYF